jgi:calcineurin-like phosphoesterase family protein
MKLKLNVPLDKIWVSSDQHVGHKNIVGPAISNWDKGYRTFNSIPEMDQEIIAQINNNVKEDDYFFILGDFAYLNKLPVDWYRKQINCKNVFLIRGNHNNENAIQRGGFSAIYDYLEVEVGGEYICMFHYKPFIWNRMHKGSLFLYGHSHSTAEHTTIGKSMDIGIDNYYRLFGEYRPFNLANDIIPIMDKRSVKVLDHHDKNTNE